LRGTIFKDPQQNIWQTADEYLSGNVRRKLRIAQRAAQDDPAFQVNVGALAAAQPKDLEASEIEVRLGATWIASEYVPAVHVRDIPDATGSAKKYPHRVRQVHGDMVHHPG